MKVIKIPGETPSSKPVIHKINLVIDGATFSDDARFKTFLDMLSESESKYQSAIDRKQEKISGPYNS